MAAILMANGVPVVEQDLSLYAGPIAADLEELKDPVLRFKGRPMPLEIWGRISSFLCWTYDQHKVEAQCRMVYNEAKGLWSVVVLPQYIEQGLHTEEIEKHGDRDKAWAEAGEGFSSIGTVHHHCGAGAFQSGTDFSDEIKQNGLHITLGNLNQGDQMTYHARASLRKVMYLIQLAEWLDFPLEVLQLDWRKLPFPEAWKERLIEKPKPVYTGWGGSYGYLGTQGGYCRNGVWHSWGGDDDDYLENQRTIWNTPSFRLTKKERRKLRKEAKRRAKQLLLPSASGGEGVTMVSADEPARCKLCAGIGERIDTRNGATFVVNCEHCRGTGVEPFDAADAPVACPVCKGIGTLMHKGVAVSCEVCDGSGVVDPEVTLCPACEGKGKDTKGDKCPICSGLGQVFEEELETAPNEARTETPPVSDTDCKECKGEGRTPAGGICLHCHGSGREPLVNVVIEPKVVVDEDELFLKSGVLSKEATESLRNTGDITWLLTTLPELTEAWTDVFDTLNVGNFDLESALDIIKLLSLMFRKLQALMPTGINLTMNEILEALLVYEDRSLDYDTDRMIKLIKDLMRMREEAAVANDYAGLE